MKTTATILAALAIGAGTACADLDAKSMDLVKAWAGKQGYTYTGVAKRFNSHVFKSMSGVLVFAPVTSDTADEAINALLASNVTNAFRDETAETPAAAPAPTPTAAPIPAQFERITVANVQAGLPSDQDERVADSDLAAAYEENPIAADAEYKGRTITVTGTIKSMGREIMGSPYVVLGNGVQLGFTRSDEALVASLKKGQRVAFSGNVRGKIMFNVYVSDCALVAKE